MGKNEISAQFNLPSSYGVKNNTLVANTTINYAALQISGKNVSSDQVTVNYDGSLKLSASVSSIASLQNAGIVSKDVQYT
ncbi:hypothetical protein IKS57_05575 [bacterium]|nr:hypothetical protein [bacterium]